MCCYYCNNNAFHHQINLCQCTGVCMHNRPLCCKVSVGSYPGQSAYLTRGDVWMCVCVPGCLCAITSLHSPSHLGSLATFWGWDVILCKTTIVFQIRQRANGAEAHQRVSKSNISPEPCLGFTGLFIALVLRELY